MARGQVSLDKFIEIEVKEEGVATAERLLYAYHRLKERFRNVKELLKFVEENLDGWVDRDR